MTNVSGDLGGADNVPCRVFDRGYSQRDVQQCSVFAPAYGLKMLNALTGAEAGQYLRFFSLPVVWNQQFRYSFADRFFGRVPKQPLRAPVPSCDYAVQILADDGVLGRIHNRTQEV